jgi:hypothetical protein
MRTYLRIDKDATIYERFPTKNTGLDEILEIGKLVAELDGPTIYASASARALLSFDITQTAQFPTSSQYFLRLFLANGIHVNRYQTLEVRPVSESWIEGSGYFYLSYPSRPDPASWVSGSGYTEQTNLYNVPGVTWDSSPSSITPTVTSSIEEYPIQDIRIDITPIITAYQNDEFVWNGIVVKFPDADEIDSTNIGNIKVFSSNTHTIYNPLVEVAYDSQVFVTGSLKPIPNGNVSIVPRNLKQSYTRGEIDKVYLVVRDPYPDKRFDAKQRYRNTYYLPQTTYYRLVDQASGVKIHDFDQYSAVNCDASGSYILLDTTGLDINRFYSVELKVQNNQLVYFPEFTYTFKVDTDG